jgi:UDP-hydrolysing UDP-N-acetyl-D-glucosamine 2-epimerase
VGYDNKLKHNLDILLPGAKMKRKILYISGTRADFGLMQSTLHEIEKRDDLELEIIATGMHLMDEFGHTLDLIEKEGFKVHTVNECYENDSKGSMARFVGRFIQSLTDEIEAINPEIILLLGDRGEMVAGAIVGAYLSVAVAHLHGGETSSTIDDIIRNTITKLAQIHLPATSKSAERIRNLGEDPARIFVVGAPGLDSIKNEVPTNPKELAKKYNLDLNAPILLVIQHPVTLESEYSTEQMKETMEAISFLKHQTIVIYPNADAGGRKMIEVIQAYSDHPYLRAYKNIERRDYLGLMRIASAIIGNSSSAIIEAPSFFLPAINIGTRQKGRERGNNVIDVDYKRAEIESAIQKSLHDENFKKTIRNSINPYGDGKSGMKIANILERITIDDDLLQKKIANFG